MCVCLSSSFVGFVSGESRITPAAQVIELFLWGKHSISCECLFVEWFMNEGT